MATLDRVLFSQARTRRAVRVPRHGVGGPTHRFRWAGLNHRRRYRLKFQDDVTASKLLLTGRLMIQECVEVTLSLPLSSELIFAEEVR
jgi:hypothetical protein